MISSALSILETDEQRNELAEFYKENLGHLYSIAISKVHNQQLAEDAIQEAFLRVCKYPGKFFEMEVPKKLPYMVIVIKNVINDILKKEQKFDCDSLTDDIAGDVLSVEEIVMGIIGSEMLEKFIINMPEALQQAITLKVVYKMSTQQIADALGITEGAAKKRVYNACKRIRDYLNGGANNE